MKDVLKKGISLGIGLALTSKEQAEKVIDDLVKKGEISKQESKEFINQIMNKGVESQQDFDEKIKNKLNQLLNEMNVATRTDIKHLEERIDRLEKQLENQNES